MDDMRRKLTTAPLVLFLVSLLAFVSFYSSFFSSSTSVKSRLSHSVHRGTNRAVQESPLLLHHKTELSHRLRPSPPADAVLFPGWETLVLLPRSELINSSEIFSCLFSTGEISPAFAAGVVLSSGRATFRCRIPRGVQRLRPFLTPRLIAGRSPKLESNGSDRSREMTRWSRLVYESLSTADDVILFAKGVNKRAGVSLSPAGLLCVYLSAAGAVAFTTGATSSAQEVFRCPHPPQEALLSIDTPVRISLQIGSDGDPIPTVATYSSTSVEAHGSNSSERSLICACTVVYNVAKFLNEWVLYHAAIGVERFFLYDNGSEDELGPTVSRLLEEGFHVSSLYWPWPKTQEAGFSHCAAVNKGDCEWMAFIDVDEFIFSPEWARSVQPDWSMLGSIVNSVGPRVGQISIGCQEFGPSGRRIHPRNGVTQGYTCRKRSKDRHKSILRLGTVNQTLVNSIHHFSLKEGFRTRKNDTAHVNHYKYQVWNEFKVKFRRRVSAYVVDWTDKTNPSSKDRTPGLGFEPIEPAGWSHMFCEVNDTQLRAVTWRWFQVVGPDGRHKMAWEY